MRDKMFIFLLPLILLNPVSCGADDLLGDAHDAADGAGVQAHLIEAEERLRAGERSSGIDGFSQSPAFVSETFCTFAAGNV
jgi:hypothetical protein